MSEWTPNEHTLATVDDFLATLLWRLPYLIGLDELINDCEIIDTDPEAVGAGTVPRYVTVTINRYHQNVVYRGTPELNVGDIVTVAHFRRGHLYEIISASGSTGSSTVPLPLLGSYARGRIIRGGATAWEAHNASVDGAAIAGDGTDVESRLDPTWKGQHTWTTGGIRLLADSLAVLFGAGSDMDLGYDGSDGYIRTDLVAPSDLNIDCGANKTIELQTVVWDDYVVPAANIRLPGAQPASAQSYKSGYVLSFSSVSDNTIYFITQMPHKYQEGTDFSLHLHWTIPVSGAGVGAENVKWDVTYSGSDPGESWPAAANATVTVDVQNDAADDHLVDTIVTVTGTNYKISNVLIWSLTRDTSVANDYTSASYLVSADLHYQIDTMGSRQEWIK
jgi:hypothetical protein